MEEGRFILAHGLRGLHLQLTPLLRARSKGVFRSLGVEHLVDQTNLPQLTGNRLRKGPKTTYSPKQHTLCGLFLQLSPTSGSFHRLSITTPHSESIHRLGH